MSAVTEHTETQELLTQLRARKDHACDHLVELLDLFDEADREWREERPEDREISSDDFRRLARLALLDLGHGQDADL